MRAILIPSITATLLAITTASAHAQAESVGQPNSLIIPNYNRTRVGKDEALQGGAFLARTTGAAANVYNPAGLASSKGSEVAASSTGYEYLTLEVAGVSRSTSNSDLSGLGSYFGFVLAEPVLHTDRWRLGFSISEPLDWNPPSLTTIVDSSETGDSGNDARLTSSGSLGSFVPQVAVGVKATSGLRFGAALAWSRVSFSQNGSISTLATTANNATAMLRHANVSGQSDQLRLTAGAQWDIIPALTLGLVVTSPGLSFKSSGRLAGEGGTYSGTSLTDARFLDESAKFTYKQPFQLGGGLAFRTGPFAFEADVRWYASVGDFALFSSDATGTRTTTNAGGAPTTAPISFAPTMIAWRDVVNLAAGGHVDLSSKFRVHLGFFTDRSPVRDRNTVFPKLDLYGGTAGVSFALGKVLSGSVGLSYTRGQSAKSVVGVASSTGEPVETEVKLRIIQLVYSLQVTFGS